MTSKKTETKQKVQSKLSFYDMLWTKPVPKVTETPKETTKETNTEKHDNINDKLPNLFDKTETSTMEVDTTTVKNTTTETIASGSGTTGDDNDKDLIELPLTNTSWGDTPMEGILAKNSGNLDEEALSPQFVKDRQQELNKNQSDPTSSQKGKSKESADKNTNEEVFIRVPKIT